MEDKWSQRAQLLHSFVCREIFQLLQREIRLCFASSRRFSLLFSPIFPSFPFGFLFECGCCFARLSVSEFFFQRFNCCELTLKANDSNIDDIRQRMARNDDSITTSRSKKYPSEEVYFHFQKLSKLL